MFIIARMWTEVTNGILRVCVGWCVFVVAGSHQNGKMCEMYVFGSEI